MKLTDDTNPTTLTEHAKQLLRAPFGGNTASSDDEARALARRERARLTVLEAIRDDGVYWP